MGGKVDSLSVKERDFCLNYVMDKDGNGTQAAIKAGYAERSAGVTASRLLTKAKIKNEIERLLDEISESKIAQAREVLQFMTSAMRGEVQEDVVVVESIGDFMTEAKVVQKQISAKDRIRAAELLGKKYKQWVDKIEEINDTEIVIRMEGIEDLCK